MLLPCWVRNGSGEADGEALAKTAARPGAFDLHDRREKWKEQGGMWSRSRGGGGEDRVRWIIPMAEMEARRHTSDDRGIAGGAVRADDDPTRANDHEKAAAMYSFAGKHEVMAHLAHRAEMLCSCPMR